MTLTVMPKPTVQERIDEVLQRWNSQKSSIKYYGLFVNNKLVSVGNMPVYRKAGLVKSGMLHRMGFRTKSWYSPEEMQRYQDAVAYIDELIAKRAIEIKEV